MKGKLKDITDSKISEIPQINLWFMLPPLQLPFINLTLKLLFLL